jgi:hypothetical protein
MSCVPPMPYKDRFVSYMNEKFINHQDEKDEKVEINFDGK